MSQSSAFDLHSDDGARRLLYVCAFVLFFVPYFQAMAGIWPLQLSAIQWRYQATTNMSGILMLPYIGLVLALAIARSTGNKTVARVVGVVAALTTIMLIIAMGLFVMDALQLKKVVPDGKLPQFNKTNFVVGVTLAFSFVVFIVLTITSFRPPQGEMKFSPPKTKFKNATGGDSPGLLIGQDYSK